MIQIAPSILAADFAKLGQEVKAVTSAGADLLHIDIMDGHFVPNLTFGPALVKSIRPYTNIPFDVHLMLSHPADFIPVFAQAGADYITVHLECAQNIEQLISYIKREKKKVGISIKPETKVSDVLPFIPQVDLILLMGVSPGFGGQEFQKKTLEKIVVLKELIGTKKVQISVDGGVNAVTAPACITAGADILVAGSAIFGHKPYQKAIQTLRGMK